MTEHEIIDLIKSRNEEGVNELLKHYRPLMSYIIAPILSNPEDQEECISETAMKVWENIHTFDEEKGNFRTWLTAVTRNTALNHLRKSAKQGRLETIPDYVTANRVNPEEIMLQRERQEHLHNILLKLSYKERALFYRKYYYLQSTAQIAREMGMTERAVEGKLYRLKQKLRKLIGGGKYE